ncbi:thioredoxin family protein [Pseudoramibacter alactolyticus]|uniref:thioredoxin family protein n=1 Tax=Pseudoramibacter alactolyticus TaxID=113287 RepID=UPI000301BE70|nr:thioredoxin family protein [Pseudoramibacter alactolyticus]
MGSLGRQLKRRRQQMGEKIDRPRPRLGTDRLVIKVVGERKDECREMVANARRAVAIAGLDAEVRCVAGRGQGAAHRIFQTPGMLIDGRRIVMGRTLSMDAMLKTLKALGYTDEK